MNIEAELKRLEEAKAILREAPNDARDRILALQNQADPEFRAEYGDLLSALLFKRGVTA